MEKTKDNGIVIMEVKELQRLGDGIEDVKRFLILQLLMSGASQGKIAKMLGVSDATMSRMLPKGISSKSVATKGNDDE